MPTHIYTRLGMWEASIALNIRSAAAAKAQPHGKAVSLHYPHALDYMLIYEDDLKIDPGFGNDMAAKINAVMNEELGQ